MVWRITPDQRCYGVRFEHQIADLEVGLDGELARLVAGIGQHHNFLSVGILERHMRDAVEIASRVDTPGSAPDELREVSQREILAAARDLAGLRRPVRTADGVTDLRNIVVS